MPVFWSLEQFLVEATHSKLPLLFKVLARGNMVLRSIWFWMTAKCCWHWLHLYNLLMLRDDLHHIFKATLHTLNSSHDILLNIKKRGCNYNIISVSLCSTPTLHTFSPSPHPLTFLYPDPSPLSPQNDLSSKKKEKRHPFIFQKQNYYLSHEGRGQKVQRE